MSSSSGREGSSVNKKDSGKTYEHGSVLTQFVEKEGEPKHLTTAKKVVEAGKDAGYMGIILAGLGFTGFLMWAVLSEFFSSNSPQKLFAKALRAVKNNEQAREILGDPISGFGDTSGRGRRRRISSQEYVVNGEEHMRIVFYVAGSRRKGTAHMDLKKNENGKYICRYLVIELEGYPSAAITIEDNR
jgi:import inner membrane translocase subunit TIM21